MRHDMQGGMGRGDARRARKLAAMAAMGAAAHYHCGGRGGHFSDTDGPFGQGGPFGRGGRFGGGRSGGGGGRGRRRMFGAGELRLVLLRLIAEQPRHGYDLIKAVEEMTGGEYAPSPGTVYPTLQMMLDEGVISEVPDESARKAFAITEEGKAELERESDAADALFERLSGIGEERRSSPHRQLHRAMENLRNALRHQHAEGLEDDKVERIVDLIDELARKIERL